LFPNIYITIGLAAYMSLIMDAIKLSFTEIEHKGTVIKFYQKNGFVPNTEMNVRRNKTISMRKDIFA